MPSMSWLVLWIRCSTSTSSSDPKPFMACWQQRASNLKLGGGGQARMCPAGGEKRGNDNQADVANCALCKTILEVVACTLMTWSACPYHKQMNIYSSIIFS